MNVIKFVEHFNILNVIEPSQSLHFHHRAGRSTEPSGKALGCSGTKGHFRKTLAPTHARGPFPGTNSCPGSWAQCWALDAVLFHTTASLQTKHDLFSKGGVNYSSLRVTGELRKQRKRQFLIIPTDWGAQTPAQTSYASIHFLMTSALESPEMLPKGTSQKGLEEGRVDIGLKKRISIPRRRPQFPSKGRTILTYLIPGSRSFFSSSLHGRPSGRGGLSFILQAV